MPDNKPKADRLNIKTWSELSAPHPIPPRELEVLFHLENAYAELDSRADRGEYEVERVVSKESPSVCYIIPPFA